MSHNYAPGEKIWLNSKYIKIKKNKKLKSKSFGPFRVLHLVGKQAYKQGLSTKWKIKDVFHVLLLEQDTIKKRRVDKTLAELEKELKFQAGGNKKYEIKIIIENAVYGQQANNSDQMPGLHYLVLWKSYLKEKNT